MSPRYEEKRCSACGGVYHPATGHALSARMQLCGPCAREMLAWVKQRCQRRSCGPCFYTAAETSLGARKERE